jgi:hypothetical protein
MDMDVDAEPVIVAPDTRGAVAAGGSPGGLVVAVATLERSPRTQEGVSGAGDAPAPGGVPALLPRAPLEVALSDNQLIAAAELVRRGLARQVLLANATVDSGLPADLQLRGTAIHLERLPDGRTRVTAGPSRA